MAEHPLNLADPHRQPRQFCRVGIEFDPQNGLRANGGKSALQAQRLGLQHHLMFEVLERPQRHIEKIARTTRRVQHPERPQPFQKTLQRLFSLDSFGLLRGQQLGYIGLDRRPFRPQRVTNHRLDQPANGGRIGIVRAQLRPLVRVQAPLEQRAENRRLNRRPVQRRCRMQRVQIGRFQRQTILVIEQPAVEPGNPFKPESPTLAHRSKQIAGQTWKVRRRPSRFLHQRAEQPIRQQPDVLGEQAEQQPGHEMRDRLRRMTALAQALRQTAQQRRGGLRHCLPRPGRLQPLRFQKRPAQEIQPGGIGQIVQRQPMGGVDRVREIGVNLNRLHVRDDQQHRVFQRQGVLLQLPKRRRQILVFALVLPGETMPAPDIGPPLAAAGLLRPLLEGEPLPARVFLQRGLEAQQATQGDEMTLGAAALGERTLAANPDEFSDFSGGGHRYNL